MERLKNAVAEHCPRFGPDSDVRLLQAEGLERHRAARCPNLACVVENVPEPTFNRVLKWVFLFVVFLCLLSNILQERLPNNHRNSGRLGWNTIADLSWPLIPIVTDWEMNVLIIMIFVAVVYGIRKKLKDSRRPAPRREDDIRTLSASVQCV